MKLFLNDENAIDGNLEDLPTVFRLFVFLF